MKGLANQNKSCLGVWFGRAFPSFHTVTASSQCDGLENSAIHHVVWIRKQSFFIDESCIVLVAHLKATIAKTKRSECSTVDCEHCVTSIASSPRCLIRTTRNGRCERNRKPVASLECFRSIVGSEGLGNCLVYVCFSSKRRKDGPVWATYVVESGSVNRKPTCRPPRLHERSPRFLPFSPAEGVKGEVDKSFCSGGDLYRRPLNWRDVVLPGRNHPTRRGHSRHIRVYSDGTVPPLCPEQESNPRSS